ncbi:MAG TPA: DNA adenine methylase [Polyangiaceae bacterium]|nr:DNA adenine methylase [Polyangiaceae bacterium]
MDSASEALPLLKWAGGKRQLTQAILGRLPARMETYYEPFVGGGAIFFALYNQRRFQRAVLSDRNEELIETYRAVQADVDAVMRALRKLPHSEEAYYEIRAQRPRLPTTRAARMIYLNRTGYNGLYRVNRAGEFNVPFGRYVRPNICDEARLRAVARALSGVELRVADFQEVAERAGARDAVYFDPPYAPVSPTARFAEYHKQPFDDAEQLRLARLFESLVDRGVTTVLSNSYTPRTREIFGHLAHDRIEARRSINSKKTHRGPVFELLVHGAAAKGRRAGGERR